MISINGQTESATTSSKIDDVKNSIVKVHDSFQQTIKNQRTETDRRLDQLNKRINLLIVWGSCSTVVAVTGFGLSIIALTR